MVETDHVADVYTQILGPVGGPGWCSGAEGAYRERDTQRKTHREDDILYVSI